ncbi:hypothetical protein EV174_002172 [Coemansia sp. RSA 2320]|nr:hypothetical protein EV174_002172 [Coemansia sp. RSA 2320]
MSKEFLQENAGDLYPQEYASDITENPLRSQLDSARIDELTTGLLKSIIERHPENQTSDSQVCIPLPSSELLVGISNSIANREAEKLLLDPSAQQSLNESMSGSSLLALELDPLEHDVALGVHPTIAC